MWVDDFKLKGALLLIKINNTKLILGINYAQKESRSETFADDTSILSGETQTT